MKKSFKVKIITPTVVILIALVVIINIFLSVRFSSMGNSLIDEKLLANTNSLKRYLDYSTTETKVAASSAAVNYDVIKAVRERDTKVLLEILTPACEFYNVHYFTITDNKGIVLARTHDPERYGDSIIGQKTINDALEGKTTSNFEEGTTIKVTVRTGAPVYDVDGFLAGVITAGVRFDLDSRVESLKGIFGSEVTVFFGNIRVATTIMKDGKSIVGTTIDPRIAEVVIEKKQEYSGEEVILGKKYKTFYKPLLNAENEAFATIFLGIPLAELIMKTNDSIRVGIILGLSGLAISITLLYFIISSISKPITKLSNDMNHIANGNLRIDINVKGEDEVGNLCRSLKKIADILHKLIEDINIMISEHEKGNVDYCLNNEEFKGDYKVLATNILELATFSVMDPLTKIPNRRSFDNRLTLEWNRAIRGKTKLSILVLDIDKFKYYNDEFGHQQGDLALKTVAGTIMQSVKRSIDFAARWGGEEFIVLLPETDLQGAMIVAERIRKEIENMHIPCSEEKGKRITISIGVNTQIPMTHEKIDEFISVADAALYKAKETGRNKVVTGVKDSY